MKFELTLEIRHLTAYDWQLAVKTVNLRRIGNTSFLYNIQTNHLHFTLQLTGNKNLKIKFMRRSSASDTDVQVKKWQDILNDLKN